MTKDNLAQHITNEFGMTKSQAEKIVDSTFDWITKMVAGGEKVLISGFGAFEAKKRHARLGINPRTGEKITIPETITPKFRAGKGLKRAVKAK